MSKPNASSPVGLSKYARKQYELDRGLREAFEPKPQETKSSPTVVVTVMTLKKEDGCILLQTKAGKYVFLHEHVIQRDYPRNDLSIGMQLLCLVKTCQQNRTRVSKILSVAKSTSTR